MAFISASFAVLYPDSLGSLLMMPTLISSPSAAAGAGASVSAFAASVAAGGAGFGAPFCLLGSPEEPLLQLPQAPRSLLSFLLMMSWSCCIQPGWPPPWILPTLLREFSFSFSYLRFYN